MANSNFHQLRARGRLSSGWEIVVREIKMWTALFVVLVAQNATADASIGESNRRSLVFVDDEDEEYETKTLPDGRVIRRKKGA